jgi:hypothetical protein
MMAKTTQPPKPRRARKVKDAATECLSRRELTSVLAAFRRMSVSDQASIYGLIHDRAAATSSGGAA